jgi:hypothetical protein
MHGKGVRVGVLGAVFSSGSNVLRSDEVKTAPRIGGAEGWIFVLKRPQTSTTALFLYDAVMPSVAVLTASCRIRKLSPGTAFSPHSTRPCGSMYLCVASKRCPIDPEHAEPHVD